ncbi:MAG: hypothetical protein GYB68_07325 [Chloroflexi bacterium]|nr:hypothetical protein [Chloroflexota bacterium]
MNNANDIEIKVAVIERPDTAYIERRRNIWDFQQHISQRLLIWSVGSIVAGLVTLASGKAIGRGLGIQNITWGAIDGLIAIFGLRAANQRMADPEAMSPETEARETENLRRILWINTGLNIGYLLTGAAILLTRGRENEEARGHGIGVLIQGSFLFVTDLLSLAELQNKPEV